MTEIKQYSPNNNVILVPRAGRVYQVKKGLNNQYITGLTDEQVKRLGAVIGEDLSATSDYWKDYTMKFHMPRLSMQINEKAPDGEIFITVAKANKLLAEDEEQLKSDIEFKRNTIFYIHDIEVVETKKVKLIELKDEVSHIIYEMRNNKDKMRYICFKLGKFVTETMKAESLYNMLSSHKENLKKFEQLDNFKTLLKTPNEQLQSFYFVKMALKYSVVVMDYESKQYKFQEKSIGDTEAKLFAFFSDKKNEMGLVALINEVKEKIE